MLSSLTGAVRQAFQPDPSIRLESLTYGELVPPTLLLCRPGCRFCLDFGPEAEYNDAAIAFFPGVSRHDTPEMFAAPDAVRRVASVLTLTLFALGVGFFPVSARAENEGQADLDKATQQKLGARRPAISRR